MVIFHEEKKGSVTHDVELQEVSETRGAVHPDQDSILQMCAEADGQPVCPGAGAVVGRPRVRDQSAVPPKYVRRSRWRREERGDSTKGKS